MSATFIRLGVKFRFFETYPSRFSDGRVHLQMYLREHRQWVLRCTPNDIGAFAGYHGQVLDQPAELTCKRCIKADPR